MKTVLIFKNLQGVFGHFKENNLIILSKVAKIALKIVFKLKRFSHKIGTRLWRSPTVYYLRHAKAYDEVILRVGMLC